MKPVYWISPLGQHCELTGVPFNGVMYDAPTGRNGTGPWGNICEQAFTSLGGKLGTGRGQKYELQADGRWLKTGG